MSSSVRVSQSTCKAWRQCPQLYHYRYVARLEPNRVARPLMFGRIAHEIIEAEAEGDDWGEVLHNYDREHGHLFREEREFYGEIIADIEHIMGEYFVHWSNDPLTYMRRNGRSTEHKFEIEVDDGILFTGKIDAVARSRGMRWLVEHKTLKQWPNADHRWRDLQSAVYIRAMEIMGWPAVDGTLWDYIWSKSPTRPKLLQRGGLSTKKIDTLPGAIGEVIDRHELDPKQYEDFIREAEGNRDKWFQRIYTRVRPAVVAMVWADFIHTAREIRDLAEKRTYRNIGRHCEYCAFEPLCRAALTGGDYEWILERQYHEKPSKNGTDDGEELNEDIRS